MRLKHIFSSLLLIFALFVMAIPANAISGKITIFEYYTVPPQQPSCEVTYIALVYDRFFEVDDGQGHDDLAFIIFDKNSEPVYPVLDSITPGDPTNVGYWTPLRSLRPIPPGDLRVVFYDEPDLTQGNWYSEEEMYQWLTSHGRVLDTAVLHEPPGGALVCGTLPPDDGGNNDDDDDISFPSAPFNPNDGRLNTDPGAIMAFYAPADGSIKIYGIDAESHGYLSIYLTPEDLAALPDKPAENLLIRVSDDKRFTLYKLTTGEYQVNAGPDSDGKMVVYTFGGDPLAWLSLTDFNVNDPP